MLKVRSRRIGVGVFSSATLFALSALANPATALAQGVPPTVTPAPAEASGVGGPGESCRARTDCAAGLKCVSNACHDEMEGASCTARTDCGGKLACVGEKCVVSGAAGAANANGGNANGGNGAGGDSKKWKGFEGVRPFVGLTLGGGPTHAGSSLGSTTQGGFLFAQGRRAHRSRRARR